MVFKTVILALALVIVAPVFIYAAEEDCTLSSDALEEALDPKASNVKKILPTKKEDRHLKQTVVFSNDVKLTYQVGGCEHYAYTLTYENVEKPKAKNLKSYTQLALDLIKQTKFKAGKEEKVLTKSLEKGLQKSGAAKWPLDLGCQDAICQIEVKPQGDKITVVLSYDFAL